MERWRSCSVYENSAISASALGQVLTGGQETNNQTLVEFNRKLLIEVNLACILIM